MKKETFFLKIAVVLIGLPALAIWIVIFPHIGYGAMKLFPDFWVYVALIGLYSAVVPFVGALYQAFKLLGYIDRGTAFSDISVKALRTIKRFATAMSCLLLTTMPLVFFAADLDDAPGAILICFVIACAPLVVAVFAAVLQKLLQNVIMIKSEHDLTV